MHRPLDGLARRGGWLPGLSYKEPRAGVTRAEEDHPVCKVIEVDSVPIERASSIARAGSAHDQRALAAGAAAGLAGLSR
jgi:hypothetical protein